MATVADLVAQVRVIVDVDDTSALSALNDRYATMVARARSMRKTVDVGPTVVAQAFYAVTGVIEVDGITVGGVPYGPGRRTDVYSSSQSMLTFRGPGGVVVVDADGAGVQGLTLVPPPTAAGLSIVLYAAVFPADLLSTDNLTTVRVDRDMRRALVEAAAATYLRVQGEGNADVEDARFDARCEEFRRRVSRRFRSGPDTIRVVGINA